MKYASLIRDIESQSWNIAPLLVITTTVRGAIHKDVKYTLNETPLC